MAEPDSTRRFRHAFLVAFANRVYDRLDVARRQAQAAYEQQHAQAGGSVALVLADRQDGVDRAYKLAHPKRGTIRQTASSATGLVAGVRAGDRADLGGTRLQSPTRAPIDRR